MSILLVTTKQIESNRRSYKLTNSPVVCHRSGMVHFPVGTRADQEPVTRMESQPRTQGKVTAARRGELYRRRPTLEPVA